MTSEGETAFETRFTLVDPSDIPRHTQSIQEVRGRLRVINGKIRDLLSSGAFDKEALLFLMDELVDNTDKLLANLFSAGTKDTLRQLVRATLKTAMVMPTRKEEGEEKQLLEHLEALELFALKTLKCPECLQWVKSGSISDHRRKDCPERKQKGVSFASQTITAEAPPEDDDDDSVPARSSISQEGKSASIEEIGLLVDRKLAQFVKDMERMLDNKLSAMEQRLAERIERQRSSAATRSKKDAPAGETPSAPSTQAASPPSTFPRRPLPVAPRLKVGSGSGLKSLGLPKKKKYAAERVSAEKLKSPFKQPLL